MTVRICFVASLLATTRREGSTSTDRPHLRRHQRSRTLRKILRRQARCPRAPAPGHMAAHNWLRQDLSGILDQSARGDAARRARERRAYLPASEINRRGRAFPLATGGASDGAPGFRPHDCVRYYAAFVLDPDDNQIEAVTFRDEPRACARLPGRAAFPPRRSGPPPISASAEYPRRDRP